MKTLHHMSRLLFACLLLFPMQVSSLPVTGLFSYEVPIAGQGDSERRRAFREALSTVLVKVTGERRWLENSSLKQALDNAQSYVEGIDYRTEVLPVIEDSFTAVIDLPEPDSIVANQSQQEYINVTFSRELIHKLLTDAAIPVWDTNRPSVLVWMALQNDFGDRSLLSAETNPEIVDTMKRFAEDRGLPIIFPVLDFEDRRNLTADMIWTLDADAIAKASQRYGADSILSGRLHMTAGGDLVGLWQFMFQDNIDVFDSVETDLQIYLNEPLERITSQLASHFSIVVASNGNQKIRLQVDGVRNLAAYSSLIAYLQNLVVVEQVGISQLQGERVVLELALQGNVQQLNELIALDRDLLPMATNGQENQFTLSYRWTR